MSENYFIKGATLSDGSKKDLYISAGKIAGFANPADSKAIVVDATEKILLPGLVDLHTHVREPGKEDSETVLSASRAAAKGGFTALSAMPNTSPVADTAGVVEQVLRLGIEAGLCDVFPIGAVTKNLDGEELSEIGAMADSAAKVRIFSDDGHCVSNPQVMRRALEYVKKFNGVIAQHAQDPELTIDAQSALRRCIELFSHNTRFFIVVENKDKLLNPILSRFCDIFVPEPAMNLHQYVLSQQFRLEF
jgi:dihydroorotase